MVSSVVFYASTSAPNILDKKGPVDETLFEIAHLHSTVDSKLDMTLWSIT